MPFPLTRIEMSLMGEAGGRGVCGTTPGSLRQIPPSVQQHFSSKAGTKSDVGLAKRRQKDNRFDASEIQHSLFRQCPAYSVSSYCLRFLYCGLLLQKLLSTIKQRASRSRVKDKVRECPYLTLNT